MKKSKKAKKQKKQRSKKSNQKFQKCELTNRAVGFQLSANFFSFSQRLSMTPSPSFCLSQASYSNVKWPIFKLLYSQSRFDEKVIEQVQCIDLHTVPLQL